MYKFVDYVSSLGTFSEPVRSALLIWAPKLTQAVFAALGDFYTWRLASKLHGEGSTAATSAVSVPRLCHCVDGLGLTAAALDDGA